MSRLSSVVAATVVFASASVAHAQGPENVPSPDGELSPNGESGEQPEPKKVAEPIPEVDPSVVRYPPSSVRLPLIIGGSVITLAAWGLSMASARTWDDVPGADELQIPVAGPWIALAKNDCAPDDPDCGAILWLRGILYVVDGIAQLGGLGLIAEGIFMTTEADAPGKQPADKTSWSVAPILTPTQTGFGVVGTF